MKESSKVLKLKLAHESYDRRSKKIASNYIIEFFEIHRRTRKKNNLFREMKEQRLLTEAKKSRQTASPNASKSIEELEKKLYFVKSKRRETFDRSRKIASNCIEEFEILSFVIVVAF